MRAATEVFAIDGDITPALPTDGDLSPRSGTVEDRSEAKEDPQWQYGRCVCVKLVSMSPLGCSAFEQLLIVLMTLFDLSQEERRYACEQRSKNTAAKKSLVGGIIGRCV